MIRAAPLFLALLIIPIAYWLGMEDGRIRAVARHQAELATARAATIRAAEAASRAEAARLSIEAERDALARDLEDQAHADTDATGGLPLGRVERLRQR
jgi:hypothetical protein